MNNNPQETGFAKKLNGSINQCAQGVQAAAPSLDATMIGRVGANSTGCVGVITGVAALSWGLSYTGINLSNGTRWASQNPAIIANSLADFIARKEEVAYRKGKDGRPLVEQPIHILNANLN